MNNRMKTFSYSFVDIPLKPRPVTALATSLKDMLVHCPKCEGRGKWNLVLDFFEPGKHMQSLCGWCKGEGWVSEFRRKQYFETPKDDGYQKTHYGNATGRIAVIN